MRSGVLFHLGEEDVCLACFPAEVLCDLIVSSALMTFTPWAQQGSAAHNEAFSLEEPRGFPHLRVLFGKLDETGLYRVQSQSWGAT